MAEVSPAAVHAAHHRLHDVGVSQTSFIGVSRHSLGPPAVVVAVMKSVELLGAAGDDAEDLMVVMMVVVVVVMVMVMVMMVMVMMLVMMMVMMLRMMMGMTTMMMVMMMPRSTWAALLPSTCA